MRIKELREKLGLTQKELADAMNVAQSTVACWETGRSLPRSDMLPRLAKTLKASVKALYV